MPENQIIVIDVSDWKQRINHMQVSMGGYRVVINRVQWGHRRADQSYAYNHRMFNRFDIDVPGYMFFDPRHDWKWQCDTFLAALRPSKTSPVFDLENLYGVPAHQAAFTATKSLEYLTAGLGYKPILYTRALWFNRHIFPRVSWAGEYPLWIAHYTKRDKPLIPKGWSDYLLWQYTDNGIVKGIQGDADLNRLNGSLDDLYKAGKNESNCP